ncbi:MAG: 50S ribosomal protein L17 [Oscillospiraceae bacterium]|nr:50S ribosomal protein L17 [Oscillospiraceae bacterium]
MAHQRKLGKTTDQRLAMLRQLTTSVLEHGRIETTTTRAKEVRKLVDKMITLGKTNTLHTRRQALSWMTQEDTVTKLFEEIAPKYAERNGGYTRIIKIGPRRGDAAEISVLELV